MISPFARHEVARLRRLGWPMSTAWDAALVRDRFTDLENEERVRLRVESDETYCYEDSDDPDATPAQRAEMHDRIDRDGAWGLIGEYRQGDEWIVADSVWGFVGNDYEDSLYDTDIMRATIEAYEASFRPTYCAGSAEQAGCSG